MAPSRRRCSSATSGSRPPEHELRHQLAAVHELARIEMLAGLPGETLSKLASRTIRRELRPGEAVAETEADRTRFYLVISGMLQAPSGAVLRPGDTAGGPSPLPDGVQAMLPSTVASCDRATFDELIGPAISADRS